jgi:hypothetical protein
MPSIVVVVVGVVVVGVVVVVAVVVVVGVVVAVAATADQIFITLSRAPVARSASS